MKTKIFIIQAPNLRLQTGDIIYCIANDVFLGHPNINVSNVTNVDDSESFKIIINNIVNELNEDNYTILIDIETHANATGIYFSDTDFVSWSCLAKLLSPLDHASYHKLCIILSSCLSCGFASYLHNNRLNNICRFLLSTCKIVTHSKITARLRPFFEKYSETEDIKESFKFANGIKYNDQRDPSPYILFEF